MELQLGSHRDKQPHARATFASLQRNKGKSRIIKAASASSLGVLGEESVSLHWDKPPREARGRCKAAEYFFFTMGNNGNQGKMKHKVESERRWNCIWRCRGTSCVRQEAKRATRGKRADYCFFTMGNNGNKDNKGTTMATQAMVVRGKRL